MFHSMTHPAHGTWTAPEMWKVHCLLQPFQVTTQLSQEKAIATANGLPSLSVSGTPTWEVSAVPILHRHDSFSKKSQRPFQRTHSAVEVQDKVANSFPDEKPAKHAWRFGQHSRKVEDEEIFAASFGKGRLISMQPVGDAH